MAPPILAAVSVGPAPVRSPPADAPYVGALLRLCWRQVWDRIQDRLRAKGFDDLELSDLTVFQYPGPEATRPADLARRMRISRQALNHLLAKLETLDYLERRASGDGERRLVHLTKRGQQVMEIIFATLRELQDDWADRVGPKRFAEFMDVLKQLAAEPPVGQARDGVRIL